MRVRSGKAHFALHYLEMVVSMFVGMLVLWPLWLLVAPDDPSVEVSSLVMATTMSVGMAAWMRFRRHGWRPIAEMCAAMYLSYAVFFPLLWAGVMEGHGVMMGGHVLMFPAMLAAMLLRPAEYTGHAAHERSAS
ncbi:hypothetical protein [Actinomadura hibisca]|uniref:hypothetical protein n=1 Tax=Actinomadura hibisca TaxID=68565 RepID=UPI0008349F3A|nr:hypothetical protein [Actinomadura hibisca]